MKKNISKFIAALIAISMIMSLLPAQFVLAALDPVDYSTYGESQDTLKASDFTGHVYELTEVEGTYHNLELSVGVYNMDMVSGYETGFMYDSDVVDLQFPGDQYDYPFEGDSASSYYTLGTVTSNMVASNPIAQNYVGKTIDNELFKNGANITITQVEGTSFYKVYTTFATNISATAKNWTNTDTGSVYSAVEGGIDNSFGYKFPVNEVCNLYKMDFKVKDGATVTDKTFQIYDAGALGFCGGRGITEMKKTDGTSGSYTQAHNEGVYFIGFQEPEKAPGTVQFSKVQDSNGTAIQGATVTLYTDSALSTIAKAKDGTTELIGTTDDNGSVTFTDVPSGKSYYYKVTANNYADVEEKTNAVSVTENQTVDVPAIKLTKESEVPYTLNVTVKDADTNATISGATVAVSNPSKSGTTNESGIAAIELPVGTYDITASKTGYKEQTATGVSVTTDGGSTEIKLVPERASVTLPEIKDSEGNTISGMQLKVTQTEGAEAAEWGTSNTYNAGAAIEVPKNSTFKVETVSNDYSKVTLYIKSDASGAATVYTDSECTVPLTAANEDEVLKTEKIGDPIYNVVIEPDGVDPATYTATVTLKNIEANYGTFGLRYDKDLFTLKAGTEGFSLAENVELYDISGGTAALENLVTTNSAEDTIGYHVFTWGGKVVDGMVGTVNALAEEQPIATYKFTLNGTADQINADSFSVMPYDKTENGRTYIAGAGNRGDDSEITNEFLSQFWRYVDEANQEPLEEGRLSEEKAIDRGFYQAYGVTAITTEATGLGCMSDIKTVFDFDLEKQLAGLVFEVVDEDGNTIPNVEITLNDKDGNKLEPSLKTDSTGIAKTDVDVTDGDVTYTYTIDCDGYWETPIGADTPVGTVTVNSTTPPETEFVYLTLEEKIYHETELRYDNEAESNPLVSEAEATLSGDEYAYNNRDYHFNIDPKPGYKFENAGEPITAVINGEKVEVTFSKADNMYVISANQITGEKDSSVQPGSNGFKSDDIHILIPQNSIVPTDATYTVTALAGTGGSVTYPAEVVDNVERTDNKVVVSNIAENSSTEYFTFTANEEMYIERVIINGVEIGDYKEKRETELAYKFENITEDCSIAVTFWDGETPSTDSVVTLVVGDRGYADVTVPDGTGQVTNERRTFIYNAAGNLTFTTQADEGYELNAVEKEVNEGTKEDITNGSSYTISIGESENVVVYVTFKDPLAEDTFNVFVKAYVDCGEGTISPVGVLTYVKYERPEFTMTAKEGGDWMLTAVKIDGVKQRYFGQNEDDEQKSTGTYQFDSLTEDRSIGAMFTETAYNVYGIVDLANGSKSPLTALDAKTGANLKFTRQDDPNTPEDETMVVTRTSEVTRTNAHFDAKLAKGTWTVEVTKKGYLNYTITDFVIEKDQTDTNFGSTAESTEAKPIVLLIGDTTSRGTVVSLEDAGVIGSALRPNAETTFSESVYKRADVDDDGVVKADSDMVYVKENFGLRRIIQTYQEFVNGQ